VDDRESEMTSRRIWLLLGICVALRAVSLVRPCLSDDEATYSVVGREMLTGHALYRDIVDHKPPLIYVTNAATQALGGPNGGQLLLHLLLIGFVFATAIVLAAIARRFATDGFCAALLYIVFSTTLVDTDSLAANCELFMMLPLSASVLAFLRGTPRALLLSGVLVGAAMMFKYQAGIQLPLYGVALVLAHRRAPLQIVIGGALLAVGTALPIALAVAWLSSLGAWPWAWFWFRFNFSYIDAGGKLAMATQMALRVGLVAIAALPLYACAVVAIRRQRHWFLLGWLAVSVLAVMVGGRFFGHYFHQITAPLAVIAAPAAARLYARTRVGFIAALAIPALIFFGLAVAHDALMRAAGEPDPDYASVVTWLDDHDASRHESLCIWGNSPVLYFDADRPLGCRFVFSNYLTGLSPATPSQTDPRADSSRNIVPQAWDMLETDLAERRPMFIVDGSPGNVGFYAKYPPEAFPRLAKILTCRYRAEALVAGMRIFKRLPAPRC
jgi:4-amino-4-deoxy-L-arabinose transferase-like glycosyltransferase